MTSGMGIDADIDELERKADDYERQASLLRAEAKGLRSAKRYLTPAPATTAHRPQVQEKSLAEVDDPAVKRGGRQPGAISTRWKAVLGRLYGLEFDLAEVAKVVLQLEDRTIKLAEAKRQFEGYVDQGFVAVSPTDPKLYLVTDAAAMKFGFSSPEVIGGRFVRPPE